ncbi:MAG: 1-deoxy-D-xylulose-5-phosphate reductoisomerase [Polaromonas sp.]|nr:1-deoxy-D-xylulose-5-phosphate reductoisomerase [Polaromonas sp.]
MILAKKRITVLGSTGSVGVNTLDVVATHPDQFEVFALSAATQTDLMLVQCARFKPRYAVMASAPHALDLADKLKVNGLETEVIREEKALEIIASHEQTDVVMAAIVGAAGLGPCMAAARAGKRLLLANKEALVVGGDIFLQAVKTGGAQLLPIDSEHSAIFQSLPEDPLTWADRVEKIILTASGGPFRRRDLATLRDVTPEQACAHPNWVMGRKISVDSATMMNKALEVIEAKYLFGLKPSQIEVVIHPQSVVHSMVQYLDTSVVAQLGTPDMRVPIAYGLAWPGRIASGAKSLDLRALSDLTFEVLDHERFPGLRLAWEVLDAPIGTPAILNAANEIAVQSFLEKRIRFDQIHAVNSASLSGVSAHRILGVDDLLELDLKARAFAKNVVLSMEL